MRVRYGVESMATESYHPLVADDLVDACRYFDAMGSQVGNRFRKQVRESIAAINERPESFGRIGSDYRGALVQGFPYVIVFIEENQTVTIYGIRHAASDRGDWFARG